MLSKLRLFVYALMMALVFVPPPDTDNVLNYEANLIGQAALVLAVGYGLYWWSQRRAALSAPSTSRGDAT